MNNISQRFLRGAGIVILATVLAACSTDQGGKQTDKDSSSRASLVANGYQKALDALRNNAPQQAYSRLEKVVAKDSKNEKAEKLHQNLGYLLKAKKAVTEDKLTKTGEYLAKLDRVNTPKSLVKQINAVKKEYQSAKLARVYYAEVGDYYNAQKISAAGGSLEALKSLPSRYQAVAAYQSKAQKYEDLIAQAQSASTGTTPDSSSNSSSTSAASTTDNSTAGTQASSGYTNARSSKIVSSEYEKKTGSSISSATNSQVSSVANGLTDTEVLAKFRAAAGIPQEAGDQYYIQKIDSDSYQIEIRHTSPNNTAVSNLKGMYRFAVSTQVVQKMNEVSGEYVQVN